MFQFISSHRLADSPTPEPPPPPNWAKYDAMLKRFFILLLIATGPILAFALIVHVMKLSDKEETFAFACYFLGLAAPIWANGVSKVTGPWAVCVLRGVWWPVAILIRLGQWVLTGK